MIRQLLIALLAHCRAWTLVLIVHSTTVQAAEIFVAPQGQPTGRGTPELPLDLATALSSKSPAQPGDFILLEGGVYNGKFVSQINGAPGAPITISSRPGHWAAIDSGLATNRAVILQISGQWTIFRDLEVRSSDPMRQTSLGGPHPKDIRRGEGIHVRGRHSKLINLVVHDAALGIGAWSEAADTEIYGCIIYHNGWQAPDRAHGHGIYSQNQEGSRLIRDNIIFSQYDKGIQIYGSDAAQLKNHHIEGNIVFNNGAISRSRSLSENLTIYGGATGPEGVVVRNNFFYGTRFEGKLLIGGDAAKDLVFENNYVPQLCRIRYWQNAVVIGNTFMRDSTVMECYLDERFNPANYDWDQNTYVCQQVKYSPYSVFRQTTDGALQGAGHSFATWQRQTGFDPSSTYSAGSPSGSKIVVRPNAYDSHRAHIALYNWDLQPVVSIALDSVLSPGQPFQIYNAQNYFGPPVASGIFNGQSIQIHMDQLQATEPVGDWNQDGTPAPINSAPEFATFILKSQPPPQPAAEPEPPQPAPPENSAPRISSISDQLVPQNEIIPALIFIVTDQETAPEQLGVLATSSNSLLVPPSNVRVSGLGSNRYLTIDPTPNQTGSAIISVAVHDGQQLVSTSFTLQVQPPNTPPAISPIIDVTTYDSIPTPLIPFSVDDSETPAQHLFLWAYSSDIEKIPNSNIRITGSGSQRAIQVIPAPGRYGITTIYVSVFDGKAMNTTRFTLLNALSIPDY